MPRADHISSAGSRLRKQGRCGATLSCVPALADVEVSVERYTDQDQYLRSFGLGAPAVPVDGEYVPVEPSNAMLTGVATGVPSRL